MANIHPDIRPAGMGQRELVNLLRQIVAAIYGICVKLDADGGVTGTTYTANCYTALFTGFIEDCKGNLIGRSGAYFITPSGISDKALLQLLYEIFNSFETLTEQLDADGTVNDTDYEANCYTAKFLGIVEDGKGGALGNGTTYYFRPGGVVPHRELVDLLYNIVDAIETLTEQLDADTGVTDTNYEALYFTAVVLTKVQNSAGNVVGN